jgi:hypothetical protein
VLLEIGRESVRSTADEDALLADAEAIIAEGIGNAEPPAFRMSRARRRDPQPPSQPGLFDRTA